MTQAGLLYDGRSARGHLVSVTAKDSRLRIDGDELREEIAASRLVVLANNASKLRIGRTDADGWSLILDQPVRGDLLALLPRSKGYGRWIDRVGLLPALGIGAAISAAVVGIGYASPTWLAPHVPLSVERKLGTAVVGDFGRQRCANPDGQGALEELVERVSPGATKGPEGIKVAALDVPVFNAAALPGGYIVVFKPAITETDRDAFAGIIAHEVAHVQRRHVTKALIRELGIGSLIRLFAGEVGADAEQLLSLSYTRADEAQADADAIEMLRRAQISPKPTAQLFKRLAGNAGESRGYATEFLQSHPLSLNRAERFEASFDPHARYSPSLPPAQAKALLEICTKLVPASDKPAGHYILDVPSGKE